MRNLFRLNPVKEEIKVKVLFQVPLFIVIVHFLLFICLWVYHNDSGQWLDGILNDLIYNTFF